MSCRAFHGIWYGLAIYGMVYDIAWRVWHGIRGMTWYIVWPGGHGMVYDKAWRGMTWYVEMLM